MISVHLDHKQSSGLAEHRPAHCRVLAKGQSPGASPLVDLPEMVQTLRICPNLYDALEVYFPIWLAESHG
jgi:hypothetical protein